VVFSLPIVSTTLMPAIFSSVCVTAMPAPTSYHFACHCLMFAGLLYACSSSCE
jgi:hypothetical protein